MSNRHHRPRIVGPLSGGSLGSGAVVVVAAVVALVAAAHLSSRAVVAVVAAPVAVVAAVAVVGTVVVGTVVVNKIRDRWMGRADGNGRRGGGAMVMRQTGRMLPPAVREVYVEEWRAWLWDLREQGEPWYRRLGELLSIVFIAAPRLAVTLRLGSRKAVD